MSLIDRFLNSIKLSDDDYEDDDFLDYDEVDEEEYVAEKEKPARRLFPRRDEDEADDFDISIDREPQVAKKESRPAAKPLLRPAKKEKSIKKPSRQSKRRGGQGPMEVSVIKPQSMEDARDITDTLLDDCTVILNLEGLDVDIAQRIIDFTCGSCYSLEGSIQMISSYIFILTPASVDITGDYQSILSDAFDVPAMRSAY